MRRSLHGEDDFRQAGAQLLAFGDGFVVLPGSYPVDPGYPAGIQWAADRPMHPGRLGWFFSFVPDAATLQENRRLLWEYLGVVFYRVKRK